MIRFQCPRCQSVLEAPERKGGTKVNCLKCRQRLQIPLPSQ
jgi:DNA-directed RNA polymerase subunit M/transcription elongation factor TFIIS